LQVARRKVAAEGVFVVHRDTAKEAEADYLIYLGLK
jgi:hypothetical protein